MLSCILDPGNPCRGDESLRINMTAYRSGCGEFGDLARTLTVRRSQRNVITEDEIRLMAEGATEDIERAIAQ